MITCKSLIALISCSLLSFGCASQSSPPTPVMSSEQMQELMMKMAMPGPQHELLKTLAGNWNAKSSMTMGPGQEAMVSTATSNNHLIMGDRFLQCDYNGSYANMPFEGMGLIGFDNTTAQYQLFWIDNSGTTMSAPLNGYYDKATRKLELTGNFDNPAFGSMSMREVFTIDGPDHHVFEMFVDQGDGEYRSMTIDYTRQ